jgi:beta-mannosidase
MDLRGVWRAAGADDELRRVFANEDTDDSAWPVVSVPGHWRSTSEFATNDAPVLFRTRFEAPTPGENRRSWLGFDGIFYQGDVWLDGLYLGDTEGYFVPHTFEVTDAFTAKRDHLLGVEVTCSPQKTRTAKRNLTGIFQHWDCIDPDWNPGGIWRPVHIFETGPVRIVRLRVVCLEANRERAVLAIRAVLDSKEARSVRIRSSVGETLDEEEHQLSSGSNRVEWKVTVERPTLWWPHSLGEPHLTPVSVEVIDPESGEVSDERRRTTGLRQVRRDDWVFEINGERMHMKGANIGPTRMAIGNATPDELKRDVVLAKEAGLDFVRVHAHITHPAFYDAADELGMMIWQDMPLQWGYARSVRKQAIRQAGEMVDLLGHHPSIIHWCGHNEPLALDINPDAMNGSPKKAAEMIGKFLLLQALPTWNKSVLDLGIHRALTKADPSRPVTAHSGVLPGPTSGGTDSHLYFGWYHGKERDFTTLLRSFPRMARFVSEFGAQAVPVTDDIIDSAKWPDLDWDYLGKYHSLQKSFFDRNVGVAPSEFLHYADWKAATQQHQATVLRRHIEEMRRIKYRPNGGFALFSLTDPLDHAAVTWSILGHDRKAKLAYEAVADACRPVIVTADRPPATVSVHDTLALDVHVVSDVRHVLRGATVVAELEWPGGSHRWEWTGDIAADAVTRIGAVDIVLPSPAHPSARREAGAIEGLILDLTVTHPEVTATNRYASRFV